jgi:D-beta-D-heptose 7-phosphate kinase/D-beta-D-heptose 1-phosphate adenosyltransferase
MSNFNVLNILNKDRILVIGDLMLDQYLFGTCDRISPEAPVPVFSKRDENIMLGGAANVFKNIISFGFSCDIISVTGDDIEGALANELIQEQIVSKSKIFKDPTRLTTIKKRLIASGQQLIRIDSESNHEIEEKFQIKIFDYFLSIIDQYKLVIISDYNKGMITNDLCSKIINECNKKGIKVLVDPKGNDFKKYKNSFLIKPNNKELENYYTHKKGEVNKIDEMARILQYEENIENIVITLGKDGIFLHGETNIIIPTKSTSVYNVSGAGDTVIAALAICILNNLSLKDGCVFANAAASIVIQKIGTESTNVDEVIKELNSSKFKIY